MRLHVPGSPRSPPRMPQARREPDVRRLLGLAGLPRPLFASDLIPCGARVSRLRFATACWSRRRVSAEGPRGRPFQECRFGNERRSPCIPRRRLIRRSFAMVGSAMKARVHARFSRFSKSPGAEPRPTPRTWPSPSIPRCRWPAGESIPRPCCAASRRPTSTALARTRGNNRAAADLLGLERTMLVEKLRRRHRYVFLE